MMELQATVSKENSQSSNGKNVVAESGEPQSNDHVVDSVQLLRAVVEEESTVVKSEPSMHEAFLSTNSSLICIPTTNSLSTGDHGVNAAQLFHTTVKDKLDGATAQSKKKFPSPGDDKLLHFQRMEASENIRVEEDRESVKDFPAIEHQINPTSPSVGDQLQIASPSSEETMKKTITSCDLAHKNEVLEDSRNLLHKHPSSRRPPIDDGNSYKCGKSEPEPNHNATANGVELAENLSIKEEVAKEQLALLDRDGNLPSQATAQETLLQPHVSGAKNQTEDENTGVDVEFEIDSSPIASSSSSDTLTDSSDSEDSDREEYKMLDPAELASRLMQEEGGSDDEGRGKTSKGEAVRTLNEKPDVVVPRPNLIITETMGITELGKVERLVENIVLIKAKTSGENQVLEYGSVLCLENRSIIGVIAETLGRVQEPHYSVRFTNAAAIVEIGISLGTTVFFVDQHSTAVLTRSLKVLKGSDASDMHDEEVGDADVEFSDDEAEAEHKRKRKFAKRDRGQDTRGGFSQGVRQKWNNGQTPQRDPSLHDDDASTATMDHSGQDVELYTPLTRPANLHEIMGSNEAPIEAQKNHHKPTRGRRRGSGTARNERGRARRCHKVQDQRVGGSQCGLDGNQRNGPKPSPQLNIFPSANLQNGITQPNDAHFGSTEDNGSHDQDVNNQPIHKPLQSTEHDSQHLLPPGMATSSSSVAPVTGLNAVLPPPLPSQYTNPYGSHDQNGNNQPIHKPLQSTEHDSRHLLAPGMTTSYSSVAPVTGLNAVLPPPLPSQYTNPYGTANEGFPQFQAQNNFQQAYQMQQQFQLQNNLQHTYPGQQQYPTTQNPYLGQQYLAHGSYQPQFQGLPQPKANLPPGSHLNPAFFSPSNQTPRQSWGANSPLPIQQPQPRRPIPRLNDGHSSLSFSAPTDINAQQYWSRGTYHVPHGDLPRMGLPDPMSATYNNNNNTQQNMSVSTLSENVSATTNADDIARNLVRLYEGRMNGTSGPEDPRRTFRSRDDR